MTLRTLNYGNYGIFLIMGTRMKSLILLVSSWVGPEPPEKSPSLSLASQKSSGLGFRV